MNPNLVVAILSLLVGVVGFGYNVYAGQPKPPLISTETGFSCVNQADPMKGGTVWTVMYRNQNGLNPWLRMVREMGDDWNTAKRCDAIASRLDVFRKDGLIRFEYRLDPNTPKQYVICAKTKISGDSCSLVLTLMPKDDPYIAMRDVTSALLPDNPASYQGSGEFKPSDSMIIPLEDKL